MKIDWKVVVPLAVIAGVLFLFFVRVKPIEGLEIVHPIAPPELGSNSGSGWHLPGEGNWDL